MYTIMRNIFINNYRKVVRDQTFVDQTENLYHLNLPQSQVLKVQERAYDLKEMHRVVNALPKEYRVPFAMHVSGFKYREIAEKLNLPLGTVKSRIFFTRQKLQEELKDFPLNVNYHFSVGINRYKAKGSRFLLPFLFYVLEVYLLWGFFQ